MCLTLVVLQLEGWRFIANPVMHQSVFEQDTDSTLPPTFQSLATKGSQASVLTVLVLSPDQTGRHFDVKHMLNTMICCGHPEREKVKEEVKCLCVQVGQRVHFHPFPWCEENHCQFIK